MANVLVLEPQVLIERLLALVPRPRAHPVRYHGLFAPNAKHRHHIVVGPTSTPPPDNGQGTTGQTMEPTPTAPMSWMQRLRRVFAIDHCTGKCRCREAQGCAIAAIHGGQMCESGLSRCPRCGGTVRVIAAITDPALIARILQQRDARDDFTAEAPVGGARAPPALSLHLDPTPEV